MTSSATPVADTHCHLTAKVFHKDRKEVIDRAAIGFRIRDDGRGIQLDELKAKAIESGKWNAEEINKWNDQKIAELIFASGISNAKGVGILAGRGVGMDSVKHRIKECKGQIHFQFDKGKYCEFEIVLPTAA